MSVEANGTHKRRISSRPIPPPSHGTISDTHSCDNYHFMRIDGHRPPLQFHTCTSIFLTLFHPMNLPKSHRTLASLAVLLLFHAPPARATWATAESSNINVVTRWVLVESSNIGVETHDWFSLSAASPAPPVWPSSMDATTPG